MPKVQTATESIQITSRRASAADGWSVASVTFPFSFDLPELAAANRYTLEVNASQSGAVLTAAGKGLTAGDNTVNVPIQPGQEEAETVSVEFRYQNFSYPGSAATVSTCVLKAQLTVDYDYTITACRPPVSARLYNTRSAGEAVVLEWSGAGAGNANAITGYAVQQRDDGGAWTDCGTVATDQTYGSMSVRPPETVGSVRAFRVGTRGTVSEAAFDSDWFACPYTLVRVTAEMMAQADEVRLPRLLDRGLHEIRRLHPKIDLTLNLTPLSVATMILPEDEPVQVRQFVEIFTRRGSAGIYQIQSVEQDFDTGEYTCELTHGLCTLEDAVVMAAATDQSTEAGQGTGAAIGTMAEVVAELLEKQEAKVDGVPYWRLGRAETPEALTVIYTYSDENLLAAVTGLRDQAGTDYIWQTDQTTFPWALNLIAAPAKLCEARLTRNLRSARMTLDASGMCTRLYPYGMGEGKDRITIKNLTEDGVVYLDADTRETYGTIVQTFTAEDIYEAATLKKVGEAYLERHKEPAVTVELSAVDLSAATGETMDAFDVGLMCRLPLPGHGATVTERVVSMEWPDLLGEPDTVELTLANKSQEASDEIVDLLRRADMATMIGGKVQTYTFADQSGLVYSDDEYVHYFSVGVYPAILSIKLTYWSTVHPFFIRVDGTPVRDPEGTDGTIDILGLLKRDEDGSLSGRHAVTYSAPHSGDDYVINSTIEMRVIENK